jgi:16S rRNA (uracil1498-N3)-methyltransferase
MPRRRFYVSGELIQNGSAILSADQAHHLRDVLRLRQGDAVEVFDGDGHGYWGSVDLHGNDVRIRDIKPLNATAPEILRLILAPALIKSEKFEWGLQKATELGVETIVPLKTKYSKIRLLNDRLDARMSRWQRIIMEACKQSGRLKMPRIEKPMDLHELLSSREYQEYTKLLLYEKASQVWDGSPLLSNKVILCVGPEGGWDAEEIQTASREGCRVFGLGTRILRAETAALAMLSILQYQFGDLGPVLTNSSSQ